MLLCWRGGAVPDAVPVANAHLVGALVDPLLALLDLALQTGIAGQGVLPTLKWRKIDHSCYSDNLVH